MNVQKLDLKLDVAEQLVLTESEIESNTAIGYASLPGITDVNSISNFLCHNVQHVVSLANDSIVKEKMFEENILNSSEFKHSVYDKYAHGIEFRHKKTGFEGKEEASAKLKEKLVAHLDNLMTHSINQTFTETQEVQVENATNKVTETPETIRKLTQRQEFRGDELTNFVISEKYLNHFRKYRNRSFAETCMSLALKISDACEKHGIKPTLLYSGGLDSEFMCRMFMDAEVDFQIVSFKFADGSNDYEWKYVEKFVEKYPDIEHHLFEIDIDKLWASRDMFELCERTLNTSPMILTQALMIAYVTNQMKGFAICAGECRIDKAMLDFNQDNELIFKLDEVTQSIGTYAWDKGEPGSSPPCPPPPFLGHFENPNCNPIPIE